MYASYRGSITKIAVEHARPASSLERLAAENWEAALQGVLDSVGSDGGDDPGGDDGDDQNGNGGGDEREQAPEIPPAPGEPSVAAGMLRDLGGGPSPPVIVVNAPSEPAISRRVSADFSRASSSWEQRGHEQWMRKQSSETPAGLAGPEPGEPGTSSTLMHFQLGGL